MSTIEWHDFERVELRAGTIIEVEDFPEAKRPAYKLTIDFGPEGGRKRSSAQVTDLYPRNHLLGKQILAVVNFPQKQIGPFSSEVLVCGFYRDDGTVVLAVPERRVEDGSRLG